MMFQGVLALPAFLVSVSRPIDQWAAPPASVPIAFHAQPGPTTTGLFADTRRALQPAAALYLCDWCAPPTSLQDSTLL